MGKHNRTRVATIPHQPSNPRNRYPSLKGIANFTAVRRVSETVGIATELTRSNFTGENLLNSTVGLSLFGSTIPQNNGTISFAASALRTLDILLAPVGPALLKTPHTFNRFPTNPDIDDEFDHGEAFLCRVLPPDSCLIEFWESLYTHSATYFAITDNRPSNIKDGSDFDSTFFPFTKDPEGETKGTFHFEPSYLALICGSLNLIKPGVLATFPNIVLRELARACFSFLPDSGKDLSTTRAIREIKTALSIVAGSFSENTSNAYREGTTDYSAAPSLMAAEAMASIFNPCSHTSSLFLFPVLNTEPTVREVFFRNVKADTPPAIAAAINIIQASLASCFRNHEADKISTVTSSSDTRLNTKGPVQSGQAHCGFPTSLNGKGDDFAISLYGTHAHSAILNLSDCIYSEHISSSFRYFAMILSLLHNLATQNSDGANVKMDEFFGQESPTSTAITTLPTNEHSFPCGG